jgi:hypothetical protein
MYWPDRLGAYQRQPLEMQGPDLDAQLKEYGAEGWDGADYGSFRVSAWRFKDVTGAYAAAFEPANQGATRVGNYLVTCQGNCPKNLAELAQSALPHVSRGSAPNLVDYLPVRNRIARSERYILGPVSLHSNAPSIPASAAAFDFGTEATLARYKASSGDVTLAVFSFPTPDIARQQAPKFQTNPSISMKRSGPLVIAALGDRAEAAKLLSQIKYAGIVEENETPPLELKPQSAARMLLAISDLAGFVLAFCALSGLLVGGGLYLARRFGYSGADGSLTTLHLNGK